MSHPVKIVSLWFCVISVSIGEITVDRSERQNFTKILGGSPVEFSDFSFKVSVRSISNNQHACGGVILTPKWILTSGMCVTTAHPSGVLVTTGAHNISDWEAEHKVSSIILRINTQDLQRQDLALIKLVEPIELGENASTINLPSRNTVPGDIGVVSGWGLTTQDGSLNLKLTQQQQLVRANWVCSLMIKAPVNDDEICASNTRHLGLCNSDDGAPLVQDGAVIGISSWFRSCGDGRPDVYTRIWSHNDWIKEQMSEDEDSSI